MIPVLAVRDREAAKRQLQDVFDFRETAQGRMKLGDQEIVLCDAGAAPAGLVTLPLDHLALSVVNVDDVLASGSARGAQLDPGFTPDGPVEIPAFWSQGVRFVFFTGPEGAPIEMCQRLGAETGPGHSHYGLRTPLLDETEGELIAHGARVAARHVLPGTPPVEVRFLQRGRQIFELFNEAPAREGTPGQGWIGLLETQE